LLCDVLSKHIEVIDSIEFDVEFKDLILFVFLAFLCAFFGVMLGTDTVAHVGAFLDLTHDAVSVALVGLLALDKAAKAEFLGCILDECTVLQIKPDTLEFFFKLIGWASIDAIEVHVKGMFEIFDAFLKVVEFGFYFCLRDVRFSTAH